MQPPIESIHRGYSKQWDIWINRTSCANFPNVVAQLHIFAGVHTQGGYDPQIRTLAIFSLNAPTPKFHHPTSTCSEVIVLTNPQTNRRRWKHPTLFATLRRWVKTRWSSTFSEFSLPLLTIPNMHTTKRNISRKSRDSSRSRLSLSTSWSQWSYVTSFTSFSSASSSPLRTWHSARSSCSNNTNESWLADITRWAVRARRACKQKCNLLYSKPQQLAYIYIYCLLYTSPSPRD